MGISLESILPLLPVSAQVYCRYPTFEVINFRSLHRQDAPLSPEFLYIGRSSELDHLSPIPYGNFLLFDDQELPAEWVGSQTNLIVIPSVEDYNRAIEQISDLFSDVSKLDSINREILSIVHGGGNLQKVLQYVYGIVNNPVMVVDVSFNVLAHAGTSVLRSEETWRYALEHKMFSAQYISYIVNHSDVQDENHQIGDDIRIEQPNEITSIRQYSVRVSQGSVVLGYLKMLEANHPVSNFDLQVLRLVSHYVPFTRVSDKGRIPDVISQEESFLRSILLGKLTDKHEIATRQELYNLKFHKNLYLIGISFTGKQLSNDINAFLIHKIHSFFHSNLVIWVDGISIVLYDSVDADLMGNAQWIRQMTEVMENLDCVANISIPFQNLDQMRNYYRQITFCTEFRAYSSQHNSQKLLFYTDIFEYHMILSLAKELDLNDILHPAVKILQDPSFSPDLLETLFTYVRNQCSIPDTAKDMYLHYNTMKNRINRIKDLTGFSDDNSRDCFWIMLSERILTLKSLERRGTSSPAAPQADPSGQETD
jgi:hypothetical protein